MNPERWQHVKQLLDVALSLEISARTSYLDNACASDLNLRHEVETLLASNQPIGRHFLDSPPLLIPDSVEERGAFSALGSWIGPYQVLEELGHGGMGDVYRARRADGQYDKQVAIKLVRNGFNARYSLERFRTERQILANLEHPNIAHLLDSGTTEQGIPYLVMELVEGVPIDVYCNTHRLNTTSRLRLFQQVCSAAQYAHQHLVIHRDLKPSNILVGENAVPKLLDFGIAKVLDPSNGTETTVIHPMTPEYASPEQVRGEAITTVSDVYSLGVVLYELLSGHSPYRARAKTLKEIERAIAETQALRPSAAVLRSETVYRSGCIRELTPEAVSSTREGSPSKLRRRLSGDLDYIVLKALRKEPEKRYRSVEQFAEDIRRHLDGLPVSARRGTWTYHTGKFMRRHKAAAAAVTLVAFTVVAGLAAVLREAHVAESNRQRAEKRFEDVRSLANSLVFEFPDSIANLPGAVPARKLLLDRAVQYLDELAKDYGDSPDLERELAWGYQRLAVVQGSPGESNLGNPQAADASNRKAATLFEAVAKANPDNLIDRLNVAMGHRLVAFSSGIRGRGDLDQAMAITERLMTSDSPTPPVLSERSFEYQVLALMQDATGDRVHALESFREDLALKQALVKAHYPGMPQRVAEATVQVGDELVRLGLLKEALKSDLSALPLYQTAVTSGDLNAKRDMAMALVKLGEIQLMNDNASGAMANFRQARTIIDTMASADPQNNMLQLDMATMDYEKGRILVGSGRYDDAIKTLLRAIQYFEDAHTQNRPAGNILHSVGAIYIWLGDAYEGKNNSLAALQQYREAAAVLDPDGGQFVDDDARCELVASLIKMGHILTRTEDLREAEAAFRKAIGIVNPFASSEHEDIPALYTEAEAFSGLGDVSVALAGESGSVLEQSSRWMEGLEWYQKSMNTWRKIPNPSHISPNGFEVREPRDIARRLARCAAQLASLRKARPSNSR